MHKNALEVERSDNDLENQENVLMLEGIQEMEAYDSVKSICDSSFPQEEIHEEDNNTFSKEKCSSPKIISEKALACR